VSKKGSRGRASLLGESKGPSTRRRAATHFAGLVEAAADFLPTRSGSTASIEELKAMRLTKAVEVIEAKAHETLTYFAFPSN
jgi:hypothetical protein